MRILTLLAFTCLAATARAEAADLAALTKAHPADALALPAVKAAAKRLLGKDWADYLDHMDEPGHGGLQGNDYYGSTCTGGDCDAGYATLFVDAGTGAVYAAWTRDNHLFFRPELDSWPEKAASAYEFWPEN